VATFTDTDADTTLAPRTERYAIASGTPTDVKLSLALSNTTDLPLAITMAIDGVSLPVDFCSRIFGPGVCEGNPSGANVTVALPLAPHQTAVLDPQSVKDNGEPVWAEVGGISIQHTGTPGALMARGLIQQPSTGFSSGIWFSDPQKFKSSRLDGAGLRLGIVGNEGLRPVAVARNIGDAETVVTGRIPFTNNDGTTGAATIPTTYLAFGEARVVDVQNATGINPLNISTAGLEFSYSTAPGTVVMSALSVSQTNNQVFRVPLRDAGGQSSTGTYPWSLDGGSSAVVYIKNTTGEARDYTMDLQFSGGTYVFGIKTIAAYQTVAVDIRSLRTSQVPDINGHTIPLNATSGKAYWSQHGPPQQALIGRVEQVDLAGGLSMTAACGRCCPDSFSALFIDPSSVSGFIGDTTQFTTTEQDVDCFGNPRPPYLVYPFYFSSNTSVATVGSSGNTTAVGVGTTFIHAQLPAYAYTNCASEAGNAEYCCDQTTINAECQAECDVQPRITDIEPAQGPIDSSVGISIGGSGFGTSPSVSVAGTGITTNIQASSETSISVTLNISADATAGNHGVTVTVNGNQSNSVNFFVQIPTKLERNSYGDLQDQPGGCGARRILQYTVLDQGGDPIDTNGTITEGIDNTGSTAGIPCSASPPTNGVVVHFQC